MLHAPIRHVVLLAFTSVALVLPSSAPAAAGDEWPPSAQPTTASFGRNTGWAEVRSDHPATAYWRVHRDLGVGHRDGGRRRSYYTFDTSEYAGARIVSATLVGDRTAASDCRAHAVALHNSGQPDPSTTWRSRPAVSQAVHVNREVAGCDGVTGRVEWDATGAVQERAEVGADSVTLMLKSIRERSTRALLTFGRRMGLQVEYVRQPNAPIDVELNGHTDFCGSEDEPVRVADADLTPTISLVQSSPEAGVLLHVELTAEDLTSGQALATRFYEAQAQGRATKTPWLLDAGHTYSWSVASVRTWDVDWGGVQRLRSPSIGPCYLVMEE